jgi:lysozyme family protein
MSDELKPIRCYVSLAGNNKIADWYNDLTAQGRSDADEFIKNMRKTRDWKMPNYRPRLKGYRGIGELRWTSEKKEHRLVGYLQGNAFYALMGCTHKGSVYDPTDALDQADKRKTQIQNGKTITVMYDL